MKLVLLGMQTTFLGTGPAINIPRRGCACPTCKDARKPSSKSRRTNSSILIQNKRAGILIDVTPNFDNQITTELRKIRNYENFGIDAVFLTHAHKDAAGGLRNLIKWLKENKTQTTLYTHQETLQRLKPKIRIPKSETNSKLENLKIKIIKPYKLINLKTYKLISFPVFHGLKRYPTFGYLINNKIIYASDMGGAPEKSFKYFKRAEILILDASMWFGKKIKGHFNVEQVIKFAQRNIALKSRRSLGEGGKKLYLTHIGHTFPPHQKAQKQINQYLINKKISLKVRLARDGMIIKN